MNTKTTLLALSLTLALMLPATHLRAQTQHRHDKSEIVLENIFQRKSVRSYSDRSVSKAQLEMLVKAAMAAPTANNKQPWAFVIVDKKELLDSLATNLPYAKMAAQAQAAIVVCGDLQKAGAGNDMWVQDCSAAAQNLLLAAESMGLGAVWTSAYPDPKRNETVKRILRLPQHIVPLNVIPIGYPAKEEAPKDKFKPENIHWNQWQ